MKIKIYRPKLPKYSLKYRFLSLKGFPFWKVLGIILIISLAAWIDLPGKHTIKLGKKINKTFNIDIRKGLDLAGGSQLVYQLDLSKTKDKAGAVNGVIQTIDRRVNALGVTEPTIREGNVGSQKTVIVELPGITNTQDAINLIGQTAQLEFYEPSTDQDKLKNSPIPGFIATGLTGKDLKSAQSSIQTSSTSGVANLAGGEPIVTLNFTSHGKDLFSQITKRNIGKPVAIVIDNQIIEEPTVQAEIDQGTATISGGFATLKQAHDVAIALNSGALPVSIKLVQEQTIGATLGQDSIEKSLIAGIVGVILVMLFMIIYYGVKGLFASIALVLYIIMVFAIFKSMHITITLAGIAGLVLSIGAAVDANILIFERIKEEQLNNHHIKQIIEVGFRRAWSSIRDSNISSIITAAILFWFGTGIIKGFAITLLIGVIVSMFSAITISQTLLIIFLRNRKVSR
jgi:preprotein translocase subunit SecD